MWPSRPAARRTSPSRLGPDVRDPPTPRRPPSQPAGRRPRRTRRCSSNAWLRVSCTRRSTPPGARPPPSADRAAGTSIRRDWSRSRAATVCRLFFTRWWISRIVASLVISSRSRRRSSVTSRSRISGAARAPRPAAAGSHARPRRGVAVADLGLARRAPRDGTAQRLVRPGVGDGPTSSAVTSANGSPTRSPAMPSRRNADRAFGLA